jgi:LysM repeat protein
MTRLTSLSLAAALLSTASLLAGEQVTPTPAAEGTLLEEVHALRFTVEAQSKQIAGLAEQILELRLVLEGHKPPGAPVMPPPPTAEPPAPAEPPPAPPTPPAPPAPAPAAETEAPRAEATGGGVKHIVAKGETLTSIAKQYNIPIADLHKANKIVNDRKLQIGQVLSIPTAKPSEPPTDKKEH